MKMKSLLSPKQREGSGDYSPVSTERPNDDDFIREIEYDKEKPNILEGDSSLKGLSDIQIQRIKPLKPMAYRRRWIVLVVFAMLSTINNLTQYSFSPISTIALEYYNINSFSLNLLAIVYMVSGFTTRFLGMWILDSKGLGVGVFIATILNLIGCWLRWWPGMYSYDWILVGQSFCAAGMSFIDITGPKIAANWFPPNERTTATALASGPLFIAMLISYSAIPRLVTSGTDIPSFLFIQAIVSTICALLIFLFFRDKPPSPPSYSASLEKLSFIEAFKVLFKRKDFVFMFISFSIDLGFAVTFSILMDQIVGPSGYSNVEAGLLGTLWVSFAIVGGIVGGPIIDRTHSYKSFMIINMVLILIALTLFILCLEYMEKNLVLLCFIISFMGLGGAALPALLESTIEVVFPVPEASSMGILFLGLNVTAIIFTLGFEQLKNPHTGSFALPLWIAVAFILISIVTMALFKGDYKRLEYERAMKEKNNEEWTSMEPQDKNCLSCFKK